MKESSVYQYILEEGEKKGKVEGRLEGELRLLLLFGSKRLGEPSAEVLHTLQQITSPERIEHLATRLLEVESWDDLLQFESSPE